jgi:hypothetical protein
MRHLSSIFSVRQTRQSGVVVRCLPPDCSLPSSSHHAQPQPSHQCLLLLLLLAAACCCCCCCCCRRRRCLLLLLLAAAAVLRRRQKSYPHSRIQTLKSSTPPLSTSCTHHPMSLFFNSRFQDQVGDSSVGPKNLMPLLGMLDDVPNVTIELALLGDGSDSTRCLLCMDISVVGVPSAPTRPQLVSIAAVAKQMVADSEAARLLPPTCYGVPTLDLLAAVFLYTLENPYRLYSCITVPLNVSGKRTLPSLLQQLPYLKLFTLGLRCLPPGPTYHFKGALYRGIDISRSAAFQAKYDAHATAYQAGTVIVFAAPTSFSMSDQAAGEFTKGIQFVWPDGCGVKMHDLSAYNDEGEVVVEGPSMFEVTAATMTPTGTLVVVLKRIANFINYLTRDDYAFSTHAQAAVHPVALHMISGGAGAAASSSAHAIALSQPASVQPLATAQAAHPASSAISSLTVKQVSLLVRFPPPSCSSPHCAAAHPPQCHQVKSVDPDFTQYAEAVERLKVKGIFILKATDDELSALFDQMHVALVHKVELREAVGSWRANPEQVRRNAFFPSSFRCSPHNATVGPPSHRPRVES